MHASCYSFYLCQRERHNTIHAGATLTQIQQKPIRQSIIIMISDNNQNKGLGAVSTPPSHRHHLQWRVGGQSLHCLARFDYLKSNWGSRKNQKLRPTKSQRSSKGIENSLWWVVIKHKKTTRTLKYPKSLLVFKRRCIVFFFTLTLLIWELNNYRPCGTHLYICWYFFY